MRARDSLSGASIATPYKRRVDAHQKMIVHAFIKMVNVSFKKHIYINNNKYDTKTN
jgi:hypothetical protein